MMQYSRRYLLVIVYICVYAIQVVATETGAETDIVVPKAQPAYDKPADIDALVAKYHAASAKEAYKLMNQIKREIARMSREQQSHAIEKVRQESLEKSIQKQNKKKHKPIGRKKKKISKKKGKVLSRKRHSAHSRDTRHQKRKAAKNAMEIFGHSQTSRHPDPLSAMRGVSEGGAVSGGTGLSGSMGGGMGGGMGGMGGF